MAYFIRENGVTLGPLSIDQLKSKIILPTTDVWKDGLPDWTLASQLTELQHLISSPPPQFKSAPSASRPQGSLQQPGKTGSTIMSVIRTAAAAILIILVGMYLIALYNKSSPKYSSQALPPIDPEHAYPPSYLSTAGSYRPNFWQTEEEITGTITNKALHTNYKDVRIRVEFYSQTKTVIGAQDYIVYQYVPYGSTQSFTIKAPKPQATASCGLTVIGATYY